MPEDERAERHDVVNVTTSVDVENVRPFSPVDEKGLPAHGAKRANRRIHSAGEEFRRFLEERSGPLSTSHRLLTCGFD
jgi:hypothetical protein